MYVSQIILLYKTVDNIGQYRALVEIIANTSGYITYEQDSCQTIYYTLQQQVDILKLFLPSSAKPQLDGLVLFSVNPATDPPPPPTRESLFSNISQWMLTK